MHEQRVLLGIVDGDGPLGGHGIAGGVVVLAVVAGHHVLVDGIGVHHIPVGIVGTVVSIMVYAVADKGAPLVLDDGTAKEFRPLCLRIVVAVLTVDMARTRRYVRRTDDMGPRGLGVVVEGVGGEIEFLVLEPHIIIEHGQLGIGVILTPVGGEHRRAVDEFAALKEIAEVIHAVIVEGVGIERRLAVLQHHIVAGLGQLVVAIVESIVAGQTESVALYHTHMAERLERVGLFVEMGTVAIEVGTVVAEVDMAVEHLRTVVAELVVVQIVGMYQIHPFVLRLLAGGHLALSRLHGKEHAQHKDC